MIKTYTISGDKGLVAPVGPDASGNYKIKVSDNSYEAEYKFTLTASVDGGFSYTTDQKKISVVCGPISPVAFDSNDQKHTLYIGELDSTVW